MTLSAPHFAAEEMGGQGINELPRATETARARPGTGAQGAWLQSSHSALPVAQLTSGWQRVPGSLCCHQVPPETTAAVQEEGPRAKGRIFKAGLSLQAWLLVCIKGCPLPTPPARPTHPLPSPQLRPLGSVCTDCLRHIISLFRPLIVCSAQLAHYTLSWSPTVCTA